MQKKSKKPGTNISTAEVQNISKHGIWILVDDKEFFLSFTQYPWFYNATISQIYDLKYQRGKHLRWKSLDVDLDIESLKHPEAYPLQYK